VDRLERTCRAHGIRLTRQRRIVLEVLDAATDHPSTHEIHRRATKQHSIAVATVYRVLNSLTAAGLVRRLMLRDGKARYERAGRPLHPHLIDLGTGRIVEVDDGGLADLLAEQARRIGYRLVEYRLTLFGQRATG
jgi:Fur family ferric uptake transcriptional regulator